MSDDFGTINVSRSERAREIEVMREQYRRHRQALQEMIGDAPSEQLAQQYSRLVGDIDVSLAKLDDLEGRPSSAPPPTEPGMRPLVEGPRHDYASVIGERKPGAPASRVVLIVLVAIVGLALIGWLIWKASDRSDDAVPVADETVTTETSTETESGTIEPVTTAPAVASGGLVATPQSQDFGVVRKGTRAVRKFVIRNDGDSSAAIKVSRSACRCLYYQHPPSIGAKKEGTLTVTVDGAKAKAGVLNESLQITTSDPSLKTSVNVNATVR